MTRFIRTHFNPAYVVLALVLFGIYAYTPPRWQDWNQNSRFDLTRAIVERHTLRIDAYVDNTGDYALVDGHYYTDKAPGLSLAAVPIYAATRLAGPVGLDWLSDRLGRNAALAQTLNPDGRGMSDDRVQTALSLYLASLVVVSASAVAMLLLLTRLVQHFTGNQAVAVLAALIVGLGTPVFAYAQAFYGHVPAAACIVAAFALLTLRAERAPLSKRRLLGVGALLGCALLIEYPAAVAAAPLAIWAVAIAGKRAVIYGVLGALPPLLVLALYDMAAFGTPLPVGYQHSELWQEQHSTGFMSLTYPSPDALWGITGSPYRGLFFLSPILLLAIPGIVMMLRVRATRTAAVVVAGSFLAILVFTASSVMWWGGFAIGPRYLLAAVPLLALPLGTALTAALARDARRGLAPVAAIAGLIGISVALNWALTFAGQSYPSDATRYPLFDHALPSLREGDVARNLGMALNIGGTASLVPIMLVALIGAALVVMLFRRQQPPAPKTSPSQLRSVEP